MAATAAAGAAATTIHSTSSTDLLPQTGSTVKTAPNATSYASKTASEALCTPVSAGYPSSVQSPLASTPGYLKRDETALKTPITPPSAYLDFLKNLSPALMSPLSTASSAHFSFTCGSASPFPCGGHGNDRSGHTSSAPPPSLRPAVSSRTSSTTVTSNSPACADVPGESEGDRHRCAASAPPAGDSSHPSACTHVKQFASAHRQVAPTSAPSTSDPSCLPSPRSAPPRRPSVVIPASPSIQPPSAVTASSCGSAIGFSPHSARSAGTMTPVTVRHVVTRTVTYMRPPGVTAKQTKPAEEVIREKSPRPLVGDAPKGKRRKLE